MTPLAAYLLLFTAVGVGFIFVHLVIGKLIRPSKPQPEKQTIYECGEPTIGSAWVQFDLRYYVVALLFVIFDVEVAFFFPWAEVFGKANQVAAVGAVPESDAERAAYVRAVQQLIPDTRENRPVRALYGKPEFLDKDKVVANQQVASRLSVLALIEIVTFFGVLLVGYAYLWKRGDLAWVRSTLAERPTTAVPEPAPSAPPARELVGTGSKV
jgi:NADH-quinone oxidoreductase subunit A